MNSQNFRKSKKSSQTRMFVSFVIAVLAFGYYALRDSSLDKPEGDIAAVVDETKSGFSEQTPPISLEELGSLVRQQTETTVNTSESSSVSSLAKSDTSSEEAKPVFIESIKIENGQVTRGTLELPPEMARQLSGPPPELPPEFRAQLENPPPPLPEEMRAQLKSSSRELPEDFAKQLATNKVAIPVDLQSQLSQPPRVEHQGSFSPEPITEAETEVEGGED